MNTDELLTEAAAQIDNEEILDLTSQLIQFPSVNPPGDMTEIADFVCEYLTNHGLDPIRHEPASGRVNVVSILGDPDTGPVVHLNGHMDVVPVEESHWDFNPFCGDIEDGRLLGRGTSDMKGGLAGLLTAICTLAPMEDDLDGAVVFTAVPDEETSGDYGTEWLLENDKLPEPDACIIGEPTGADTISIGQKGSLWLRFESDGVGSHGSLAPHVGQNAILPLADVAPKLLSITELEADQTELDDDTIQWSKDAVANATGTDQARNALDHVTVNIGTIQGGSKVNVIPETATMDVDMRVPIGISNEAVQTEIESILKESQGAVEYSVLRETESNYVDANTPIVTHLVANVEKVFGHQARPRFQWATSDARHYRRHGIPTVQFGPSESETIHSHNEFVTTDELVRVPQVYVRSLIEYLNSN